MRAHAVSAECSMTWYYYGISRLIAEPVAKNPGDKQRCRHKDAADFRTQASGSASRKTLGRPHTQPHTEGSKRRVWQQSQVCGSTQPAAASGGRRRSRQLGFCPPPDIAAPCPHAPLLPPTPSLSFARPRLFHPTARPALVIAIPRPPLTNISPVHDCIDALLAWLPLQTLS